MSELLAQPAAIVRTNIVARPCAAKPKQPGLAEVVPSRLNPVAATTRRCILARSAATNGLAVTTIARAGAMNDPAGTTTVRAGAIRRAGVTTGPAVRAGATHQAAAAARAEVEVVAVAVVAHGVTKRLSTQYVD